MFVPAGMMFYPGGPQLAQPPAAKYFSIDVECVATGTDHNARAVAQISLVDEYERVLANLYVQPEQPVVSYLTPLTGLTPELLAQHGMPLTQAVGILQAALPTHAVLVGQNIAKDVQWLGLKEGVHFEQMMDLTGLFRVWNPQYKSYSVFGQDHLAKILLNWDTGVGGHDAVGDAVKSIRLFKLHQQLQPTPEQWQAAQAALLATPPQPSFARQNPSYEGVCMGNRKTCTCGAPFLG
ncbi:Small RNA degrading nuclease [Chlorella sorokiniana]|uniref:Small RNA degrading nuclease n=1 Tax=Chlorella sorokiniana TaxID=3076 RepID=A0A2P6TBA2_CHLSO|nr:Small RNA degrading nuclease [Chlorella sorokiniana]|eukprot:PRW05824.1 Small RNA degrading nuclease [Chlorella sorokiniana]